MTASLYSRFCLVMATILVTCGLYAEGLNRGRAFYGINADPVWNFRGGESKAKELALFSEMLTQTGCGIVRIPLRWRVMEPGKGTWDFSAVDRAVQAIPEDIEILGTLMSVPEWANGVDPKKAEGWYDAYPPKDISDWKTYVSKTVGHYKHRIKHWEIWNEQNGVDFYMSCPMREQTT